MLSSIKIKIKIKNPSEEGARWVDLATTVGDTEKAGKLNPDCSHVCQRPIIVTLIQESRLPAPDIPITLSSAE
jgi:hypothetical protein